MNAIKIFLQIFVVFFLFSCSSGNDRKSQATAREASISVPQKSDSHRHMDEDTTAAYEVQKSPEEWKKLLTSKQYRILRERGTELPYLNELWDNKKEGIYYCAACGQPLYSSKTKYKSGTGWPSFWEPIKKTFVEEEEDNSYWMTRTEIVCSRCGSHLGHVFGDGPEPTGLRYCMNSAALHFEEMDVSELKAEELPVIDLH